MLCTEPLCLFVVTKVSGPSAFVLIPFQLLMFMMDIQGDPKGLSIGGLVVINKSMSLTVRSFLRQILGNIYDEWHWTLV